MSGSSPTKPLSPKKMARLAAIEEALRESARFPQSQQDLYEAERERQVAEQRLQAAEEEHRIQEERVEDSVAEMNRIFGDISIAVGRINNAFTSPPSTPRSQTRTQPLTPRSVPSSVPPTPPASPQKRAPVPVSPSTPVNTQIRTLPAQMTINGPSTPIVTVQPGGQYPYYVVYVGEGGKHGLFFSWKSNEGEDIIGASSIYDRNNHDHVVKGFIDLDRARSFYWEFLNSDIPRLLAEQEPTPDEHFIVAQGVRPWVYSSRKSLIMDGLQYRGGVVRRYKGGLGDAWALYNKWSEAGLVKKTHKPRSVF
ncbi:hypothetical protein VKT23_019396 [Stygiomarasmius scandens]|uniref:Uncharacterized protein n=1 Tax=Marasmiellus scandens TaxID=2682957 RepID=A0ABR1IPE5_9AGAR